MKNYICIFGDIHGCFNTFESLYYKVRNEADEFYSVGDLIDRGEKSKEVVDFVIENKIHPVRGNHEDMLLRAFNSPTYSNLYNHFANGGEKTSKSYIFSEDQKDFMEYRDKVESFGHIDFFKKLPFIYEFKGVIISHAGITNGGDKDSLLWNRTLVSKLNKLQVHGHTPFPKLDYKKGHYLNIDTGCVYKYFLTAAILDTETGLIKKVLQEKFKN